MKTVKNAATGNRTRGEAMATLHFTTELSQLDTIYAFPSFFIHVPIYDSPILTSFIIKNSLMTLNISRDDLNKPLIEYEIF